MSTHTTQQQGPKTDASQRWDVLIVGGGPAGTSAAFRARELGLRALVIESDGLLRRIRDYPKDKLILPGFGGGDTMRFPAGGAAISSLPFGPIDKDDLCANWRELYRRHEVPWRLGIELTGLVREGDAWRARTWDYGAKAAGEILATHVILALGRGVPRRFDVPGDLDGIAWRLDDAERYVSGPVCVIGGGTSAAEAVISISNVKVREGDESGVYWSYRGAKMPRISKALADRFFEAHVENGNVRFYPYSEPVGVVTGPDRVEYLSIRVERTTREAAPVETVHLEFPKDRCIACIGEDVPEALLTSLGVDLIGVPGKDKKMIAVSPLLESRQPNVYVIGDLLAQSHLETEDFAAAPDSYRSVKHRGNIKSALRDGVFVAEVIRQRIDGKVRIAVEVADGPPDPGDEVNRVVETLLGIVPRQVESAPARSSARLVRTNLAGVDSDEFELRADGVTTLGRGEVDIAFVQDPALEERHASVVMRGGEYYLRDENSRAGTYLRVPRDGSLRLVEGDLIRIGRQILVVANEGERPHVRHFDSTGRALPPIPLDRTRVFGRSGGPKDPDVVLSKDDMTLSRFHMAIEVQEGVLTLQDLGSKNGTYLRVTGQRQLRHGDAFRVGGQMLVLRAQDDLPSKKGSAAVGPSFSQRVGADSIPTPRAPATSPGGPSPAPSVTFAGLGISGPVAAGQTLLAWADANNVPIDSECWIGKCGCDAIRILEGREHANEPEASELKTLKRRGLEPGPCRLACMTKISGPVVVEIIS